MDYQKFLEGKLRLSGNFGFKPAFMPDFLFDYQKYAIDWSLKKGRAAVFADTGLGKTNIQLVTAQNIVQHTNRNVLILTPLAVSHQTVKEAEKFGIEAYRSRDGKPKGKITITNYQQLEKFNPDDFGGVLFDESSAIKNADSQTKKITTNFTRKTPYRILYTATPSPNDFVELGTSSEILGELRYLEMIEKFFRDTQNDKNPAWSTPKFVLKQHGINDFWRWVASWALAFKKPSDIGFSDELHRLPKLTEKEHILQCTKPLPGKLFVEKARGLREQREERKLTINERVSKVHELVQGHDCSVIWGHYNYETDLLEKEIDGAIQISGSDKEESKEEKFIAFGNGEIKRLVIKPKIGAWGLNWQHCNHMTFFPSHSYEQYYQAIRRSYRFGQKRDVLIDLVTTEGEAGVYENIKRKARDAEVMFKKLVEFMGSETDIKRHIFETKKIKKAEWM